ncbi:MAG TPA: histidine kinase dimerization/phospho-acceptor domain-containing protein, partial [Pseudoxanthomonas sp.]|nr:histidine kinase dimerization/phospho-acceptor domain-containing protein [Pseudoxanthomonas sp.]
MDGMTPEQLRAAVQSQASIRARLGLPVAACALAMTILAPIGGRDPNFAAVVVICLYMAYVIGIYVLTRHPGRLHWKDIVLGTAVLDPLLLSTWLYAAGGQGILVLGFYLFTILGFGLRIGPTPMRVCQAVSILGFTSVLFNSPFWMNHLSFGVSHLVLLVVVPMYAGSLMKELRQAEHESKAKSQLLANVSHELRTPLTGIVSAAQLLEDNAASPEDVRLAQSIVLLSSSLEAEINQLLDVSKLAMQPLGPPAPSVMDSVQVALQESATSKGLTFIADIDPAIRHDVVGYAREMTSVLMNLAGNAVKFTHQGTVA